MTADVLTTLLPGFAGTTLPDWLKARLRAGLGGVCLFATNVESLTQLRALTDAIYAENPQAIIAIDEEGGDVTRLYARQGSPSPGNAVLGRLDDLDTTAYAAHQIGEQLRRTGVNVNFAPSVDINSNPDNPVIGVRSFGDRAEHVARHGAAWATALQATGVAATAKHFPGHGDTALDSHLALPVIDRSLADLRDREQLPFAAAIEAGVRVVMTSHILLPQLDADQPATMSAPILGGVLRAELGFGGVIVSDALDMAGAHSGGGLGEAAARALQATGVAATAKHFPGHGDTALDSHLALPAIDRSLADLRGRELLPFAAAIEAGVRVVMTSHILLPQLDAHQPATMSAPILGGVLRAELGFGGVIVSDALDMAGAHSGGGLGETAARALTAGCDLLCLGTDNTDADLSAIEQAVAAGGVAPARIAEATDRVITLARRLPAPPEPADGDVLSLSNGPSTSSGHISADRLIRAFHRQPAARNWRPSAPDAVTTVRLQARPNSAAGPVPWGPPATASEIVVTADKPLPPTPIPGEAVLVIGQDIHRHAFARAAVDRLRAEHPSVLVVDMGWPSPDRGYADVATFGASPVLGRALLELLRLG